MLFGHFSVLSVGYSLEKETPQFQVATSSRIYCTIMRMIPIYIYVCVYLSIYIYTYIYSF